MAKRYVQISGVEERTVDAEVFLIAEELGAIHHLNTTGAAIWRLLAEPHSRKDVSNVLCRLFDDVPAKTIEGAVKQLMRDLKDAELIRRHKGGDS